METASAGPFRWDLSRPEQLGTLLRGDPAADYPEFLDDLRACCARVVAHGGEGRLVCVGRSPESIHDYLAGVLADTARGDRCTLLNLSVSRWTVRAIARSSREGLAALRAQLRRMGLSPAEIAAAPYPLALVDLVCTGATLGLLQELLLGWGEEEGVDPAAVRRRLRFVGIVERQAGRPGHWRWARSAEWGAEYRPSALRTVAVPWRLWDYLGNRQGKVSRWNPPLCWGREEMARPPREVEHVAALRLAARVHAHGRGREERERFAAALAAQPEMREKWLRALVGELRGRVAADRRGERETAGHAPWARQGGAARRR